MTCRPVSLDHVNIYVRNAERSHRWYADVLGLHTQDTFMSPRPGGCGPSSSRPIPTMRTTSRCSRWARTPSGRRSSRSASTTSPGGWRTSRTSGRCTSGSRTERSRPAWWTTPSPSAPISRIPTVTARGYYELPRSQWHQDKPFSIQGKKGRFPGPWKEAPPAIRAGDSEGVASKTAAARQSVPAILGFEPGRGHRGGANRRFPRCHSSRRAAEAARPVAGAKADRAPYNPSTHGASPGRLRPPRRMLLLLRGDGPRL